MEHRKSRLKPINPYPESLRKSFEDYHSRTQKADQIANEKAVLEGKPVPSGKLSDAGGSSNKGVVANKDLKWFIDQFGPVTGPKMYEKQKIGTEGLKPGSADNLYHVTTDQKQPETTTEIKTESKPKLTYSQEKWRGPQGDNQSLTYGMGQWIKDHQISFENARHNLKPLLYKITEVIKAYPNRINWENPKTINGKKAFPVYVKAGELHQDKVNRVSAFGGSEYNLRKDHIQTGFEVGLIAGVDETRTPNGKTKAFTLYMEEPILSFGKKSKRGLPRFIEEPGRKLLDKKLKRGMEKPEKGKPKTKRPGKMASFALTVLCKAKHDIGAHEVGNQNAVRNIIPLGKNKDYHLKELVKALKILKPILFPRGFVKEIKDKLTNKVIGYSISLSPKKLLDHAGNLIGWDDSYNPAAGLP